MRLWVESASAPAQLSVRRPVMIFSEQVYPYSLRGWLGQHKLEEKTDVQLPDGIEKLLPVKVVENLYDDVASAPAKEVSKVAVDLVKTARLFLAPIQLAAAFQDR